MSAKHERKRRLLRLEYDIKDGALMADDAMNCGYFSDDDRISLAEICALLKQIDTKLKRIKGD